MGGFSGKAKLREDGGAEGVRTPDLLNAIQALYQLSYDPIQSDGKSKGCTPSLSKPFSPLPNLQNVQPIQSNPRIFFPCSVIIAWCHGGFQTISTFASSTPGNPINRCCASPAMTPPIPQPGAVRVIFTATALRPLGKGTIFMS